VKLATGFWFMFYFVCNERILYGKEQNGSFRGPDTLGRYAEDLISLLFVL
jgi:hypothetical protein